jgi:PAN domain
MTRIGSILIAVSSIVLAVTTPVLGQTFEPNTDRMGSDYRSFDLPAPNPQLCEQTCMNESVCRAWTFVLPGFQGPQARCWLKNSIPAATASDCCTSGIARQDASTMRFDNPMIQGTIVDRCATWGTDCGPGGANLFCRSNGFARALDWSTFQPGRTWVIGSGQMCQGDFCAGFRHVTCAR